MYVITLILFVCTLCFVGGDNCFLTAGCSGTFFAEDEITSCCYEGGQNGLSFQADDICIECRSVG